MNNMTKAHNMIVKAQKQIFKALNIAYGLDLNDENILETPERIAKLLLNERCAGINSREKCKNMLVSKSFPSNYRGFVVINPITVYSLCPHHMESILYKISIGYIPIDRCIGLSKIGRIIKLYAAQPILQETLTTDIAELIENSIHPEAVGVIVSGEHNCMRARGLQDHNVKTITSEVRGTALQDSAVKSEFFKLCEF